MTIDSAISRYLDHVVPTTGHPAESAPDLTWPTGEYRPPDSLIATLLTDPSRFAGYRLAQSARRKYDHLLTLTLCIESVDLPADLASRAARLRFLVWSLRFRVPREHHDNLLSDQALGPEGTAVPVARQMVASARQARADWFAALSAYEDDPWLMHRHDAAPVRFEQDLTLLTSTWPTGWGQSAAPLRLVDVKTTDGEDDLGHAADMAEQHWLPRSSLQGAATAFAPAGGPTRLLPWVLPALSLAVMALFLAGLVNTASLLALLVPLAGFVGAMLLTGRLDALLLLRVPAATLVGAVVLVTLTGRWWLDPDAWRLGAGLLVVAGGYLMVEARLHGATVARACTRGLLITTVGGLFAFVAGLLVFRFVEPVVGEHGECLLDWWRSSPWQARPLSPSCAATEGARSAAASSGTMLLITGWSLAVGLAAQIMWDDRPVTAPLGRLRRVRGGS